ncbi:unnamed protein product [Trypanosoma congolense IL3000]|uniref:WGS project CAEQ00000000 data, annotated contig 370 n=1 Tax=Trypanosoma congolense (strain IL3000) TaxID=1068625 RepID=F9WFC5_TRYCI|nr:unnamed protein product [Trypanosoma congolense IL3000]
MFAYDIGWWKGYHPTPNAKTPRGRNAKRCICRVAGNHKEINNNMQTYTRLRAALLPYCTSQSSIVGRATGSLRVRCGFCSGFTTTFAFSAGAAVSVGVVRSGVATTRAACTPGPPEPLSVSICAAMRTAIVSQCRTSSRSAVRSCSHVMR